MKRLRPAILAATATLAAVVASVALAGTADASGAAASTQDTPVRVSTVQARTGQASTDRVAAPAACGAVWGTDARQGGPANPVTTPVSSVRAGEQPCFDRLVISLGSGPHPGYRVGYVSQILADPSGKPLPVRGKAFLLITVRGPAGASYHANAANLASVAGFDVVRQVRGAGSFESVTSIGLGVRTKMPFRAFILSGPGSASRLVIDVAR